jgi:hypothetical protein
MVYGLGFRLESSMVKGLGYMVHGLDFEIRFRVKGLGLRD